MDHNVKIYEFKRGLSDENSKILLSPNKEYFYWNDAKFSTNDPGDYIFFVNRYSGFAFMAMHDRANIHSRPEGELSIFEDQNERYEVKGADWGAFVRFQVKSYVDLPEDWNWSRQLGQSETYDLWRTDKNLKDVEKRLEKVEDLLLVFSEGLGVEILEQVKSQYSNSDAIKFDEVPEIFFVAQGKSYRPGAEGYLWAPKKSKNGLSLSHWDRVLEIRKGDFIFQYSNSAIRSIAVALEDGHETPNPYEGDDWDRDGFGLKIKQYEFSQPITKEEIGKRKTKLKAALSDLQGPFDRDGFVKQGYLFEFNLEAARIIRSLTDIPFPEPLESMIQKELFEKAKSGLTTEVKTTLNHIHQYIQSKGFTFDRSDIYNFYLSLKTKPFLILAGISGTGKSKLPQLMMEALGLDHSCFILPVRPDWTDNSDLIGYIDLKGRFQPQAVTNFFLKAKATPEQPFFLVLDEMNLARVEYYFSDFLSILESRQRNGEGEIRTHPIISRDSLQDSDDREKYGGLEIPDNVYLIGTVNMDETTHPFSRKVLDRANSIEMNEVDLSWPEQVDQVDQMEQPVTNSFFKTDYLSVTDLQEEDLNFLNEFIDWLKRINEVLEQADLHFGYRVRNEMAYYLTLNRRLELFSEAQARDFQIMQKVLPRIQGSSGSVKQVLLRLLELFESIQGDGEVDLQELRSQVVNEEAEGSLNYPRSAKKIAFMLSRYDQDGFTSFWL